jgi:ATP-dependent Clp protease ATP-binding subunit ClpC
MYPFDQFTSRAQKAMQLAETQARIAGSPLITTGHLLGALFADEGSLAVRVLTELGVGPDALRRTIGERARETEQAAPDPPPASPLPTERVKRVIELAFQAAQMMDHVYVGTEHLLLGILEEGEGVGGRALGVAGVTLDNVHPALDRLPAGSPGYGPPVERRPRGVPNSPELGVVLSTPRRVKRRLRTAAAVRARMVTR